MNEIVDRCREKKDNNGDEKFCRMLTSVKKKTSGSAVASWYISNLPASTTPFTMF